MGTFHVFSCCQLSGPSFRHCSPFLQLQEPLSAGPEMGLLAQELHSFPSPFFSSQQVYPSLDISEVWGKV